MQHCQVVDRGQATSVEPRIMDVLVLLASKLSQVISPQELLAALWPDTIFSPAAIQRCIAQLRKVMGDNAGQANKDIYGHSREVNVLVFAFVLRSSTKVLLFFFFTPAVSI